MKEYIVSASITGEMRLVIEANSKEEAIEIAKKCRMYKGIKSIESEIIRSENAKYVQIETICGAVTASEARCSEQ